MKSAYIKIIILLWVCILVPHIGNAQKNPHSIPLNEPNSDSQKNVINSHGNPVLKIKSLRNWTITVRKPVRQPNVLL